MMPTFRRALLLSPHTDDCELAMGATIAKLVVSGCDITWVICSNAVKSLPAGFPENTLTDEQILAATRLGVPKERLIFWDFPVREFPRVRQEILEALVAMQKADFYDVVFCPASSDCHQDHGTVHDETRRAFKATSILGYELPWNDFHNSSTFFVPYTETELETKIHALQAYISQAHRSYMDRRFIEGMGRSRGAPIKKDYAEAFEVVRMVAHEC